MSEDAAIAAARELIRLRQENEQLRTAAVELAKEVVGVLRLGGGCIEGDEIEDLGVRAGLVEWQTYDPAIHGEDHDLVECEEGDRIWVLTEFAYSLLGEVAP